MVVGECRDKLVELNGHTLGVYSVSWSPDSQQLITASADKTVRLWDAASGQCLTYVLSRRRCCRH
jgi:WD40 repeat protein